MALESPTYLLTDNQRDGIGMSHAINYSVLPDAASLSLFDTGQAYSQGTSFVSAQNAKVQFGGLTPPALASSALGATYELAKTGRRVRTVGMRCGTIPAAGGSTSPTWALGMFGPNGPSAPVNSPAHLAVRLNQWQLITFAAGVQTIVPGSTQTLSLAPTDVFDLQVRVDYDAATVTVWVPDGKPPHVFSVPAVNTLPTYPVGFTEMVLTASTDRFPITYGWWADTERQAGLV